jgi:antitoxin VapB
MALNIKNEEAHRLIRELAEMTGESMTQAVTVAVRERRDRLHSSGDGTLAEQLLAIGRVSAERMSPAVRDADHGELLYGPDGLPR